MCLVFAGLAISYDLLFGHTGVMSFGHGMFVTGGMYLTTVLVDPAGYGLWDAAAGGLVPALVAAVVLGAVALRAEGIGFAAVTLAFGQAVSILVISGSPQLTGGEQGQTLNAGTVPAALSGVRNTANLYWIALAYLVLCALVVLGADGVDAGPGDACAAGERAAGGGAGVSDSNFTLSLLVMAVLGGTGRRWAAIVGGVLYGYAGQSLTRVTGSSAVAGLPGVLRGPLEQPPFLLGAAFVLVVFFAPGGRAGRFGARSRIEES